jgi:hypothetical protein
MTKQSKAKSAEVAKGSYSRFVQRFADLNCSRYDFESVRDSPFPNNAKERVPHGDDIMTESTAKVCNNGSADMYSTSSTVSIDSDSDFDEVSADFPLGKASTYEGAKSHTTETMVHTSDSSSASLVSESDCDSSFDGDRRKVQFSSVSVRSYSLTVGDSPAMKSYALSLDWAHTPTETLDIEMFEELYSSAKTKPFTNGRNIRGFRLPARLKTADRFALLSEVTGHSPEDLYELNLSHLIQQNCSVTSGTDFLVENIVKYEVVDADEFYQKVDL